MKRIVIAKSSVFAIVLAVLAVSCFLFSAIVTMTSLGQPNTNFFDIPVDLSKPNTYRTDFRPARYSLGIEFHLIFDGIYEANQKLRNLEIQITLSDKTGQVLIDETKTRNDFRINRRKGTPDSLRCTSRRPYGQKGDIILEFKVINPAIGLDDKGQHLTANCMRTGMELAYAFYIFIIGLVSSLIAMVIIKRHR